jgi:hypothetical protein
MISVRETGGGSTEARSHSRTVGTGDGLPSRQRRLPSALDRSDRADAYRPATADAGSACPHEQAVLAHQPRQPEWLCIACQQAWPCPTYRQHVVHDATHTQLILLATTCMAQATTDLPQSAAGELYSRFVAWIC